MLGAFVAHLHGRPWTTYQRRTADVIGERTETGRYRYPVVVVTWPRQCGKTTWALDLAIGRGLQESDYRAAYAAQTGHVTTQRFGDRFTELEASPLSRVARLRRSAGTERVTLPSRSYVKAFPPKPGCLRSDALDLVIVDEAQEHGELLGQALDRAIVPTFTTRPRRQLVIIGTAGTDRSAYLARYLDLARSGAPGVAGFEWGARDDQDFLDESTWPLVHPGLAEGLTDVDALRTALSTMGPAGFLREYGNVWTRVSTHVFDPVAWASVQLPPESSTPTGRLALALHVDADRGSASIAIAGPDGYRELVEFRAGVDWVTARATELQASTGAPIVLDRYGATGTVADALERAGADLVVLSTLDVANAAAGFLDGVRAGTVKVYPSPSLDEAVTGAATRSLGDTGGFAWSHRDSAGPVSPLVAVSAAGWGVDHLSPPAVAPAVYAE